MLNHIKYEQQIIIRNVLDNVLRYCQKDIEELDGNWQGLCKASRGHFHEITYVDAIRLLNAYGGNYLFGDDLGIKEERQLLGIFGNEPTFVTNYPASLKFFNTKRNGPAAYSIDLLLPPLGETIGGAVREKDGNKIRQQLHESNVGKYLKERGRDPEAPFAEYLKLFEQEKPTLRGGYGIGFERFIGFILGSNDILDTIAYRTLAPD